MANTRISNLTASASNLAASDLVPVVQTPGVGPVKMTGTQIKTGIIGAGSVSIASGKTFTASNTLTLAGTDSTTMTFPTTSATIARTDAGNTFTGNQVVSSGSFGLSGNISAAAWTTSGIRYANVAATLTDTSSTGTVATAYTDLFGGNTIAASSATTFTNYYTSWFNAPTAGTNVTFTGKWALGLGGSLDIQAGTVTTNTTPALNLTQTWNAGAVTFTGLKFNATDTASASGSLLLDLQVGGASQFSVTKAGRVAVGAGSVSAPGLYAGTATSSGLYSAASNQINITGNGSALATFGGTAPSVTFFVSNPLNLNNSGNITALFVPAAAILQLGAADAAAPVAQTFKVQGVVAGTSNTAGANFTIQGSQGTGTGAGGSIIFQVAPAGSSGTAQNALATALTINSAKQCLFDGGSLSLPAITFGGATDTGIYGNASAVNIARSGKQVASFDPNTFCFYSALANISMADNGGSADVRLFRDAANTLALRNGTNAQRFNVYNTYTSSTNYETFKIDWITTANTCLIGTEKGSGGGTARALALQTDGTTRLTIAADGTTAAFTGVVTAPNLATGRTLGRAFTPLDNQPPASNFATLDTRNSIAVLDFDDATDEFAVFASTIPQAATISSGLTVIISWAATSATSGACVWGVQFAKLTGVDLDVFAFDTATTATTTTSGTSGVVNTTTITVAVADTDGLAAGDCYAMQVYRDANAGGDTMTGDAELIAVEIRQVA